MIGRRVLPCGHGRVRITPEVGIYERVCPVCKRWFTAEVSESLYWSQKLGSPGQLVLHWVDDEEDDVTVASTPAPDPAPTHVPAALSDGPGLGVRSVTSWPPTAPPSATPTRGPWVPVVPVEVQTTDPGVPPRDQQATRTQ